MIASWSSMRPAHHHPLLLHHNSWGVTSPQSPPPMSPIPQTSHHHRTSLDDAQHSSVDVLRSVALDLTSVCPPQPRTVPIELSSPPNYYQREQIVLLGAKRDPPVALFAYEYPQNQSYYKKSCRTDTRVPIDDRLALRFLHRPHRTTVDRVWQFEELHGDPRGFRL